jgi:helix-turn-helix, Psq domain
MPQQHDAQLIQNEGRISLAISAIDRNQIQSVRRAVAIYSIPRTTLRRRRTGTTARRDCEANSKKLTKLEELVII